ncbi:MAG: acyl-CoA dehydrogenase [Pseudonocardiales bacterium]|nr:MAG: acyl-CoA dehydrogenase [Pseudonocardiales bacterium]
MLTGTLPPWSADLSAAAQAAGEDVALGLQLAAKFGAQLPLPGGGATGLRWQLLAEVGAADLTAARILEAHGDALAIVAEAADAGDAGDQAPSGTWGVFAAEGPNARLDASMGSAGWRLDGTKPWCSLGGVLDHALVTAYAGQARRLFAVDLQQPSVRAEPSSGWAARGLRNIPSGPVHFSATPARPVGGPGWYLTRPGFAWGGLGVAACWYGGAWALSRTLQAAAVRRGLDQLLSLHVGAVDVALHAASTSLLDAARLVDGAAGDGAASGELLALRVRSVVADAVERVITHVGHALGPAPLAFDEEHARRVADLEIYVRQHHAERDLARLGALVSGDGS